MLGIHNRRYVGSKSALVKDIYYSIEKHIDAKDYTFADLFAGTGVVSSFFM